MRIGQLSQLQRQHILHWTLTLGIGVGRSEANCKPPRELGFGNPGTRRVRQQEPNVRGALRPQREVPYPGGPRSRAEHLPRADWRPEFHRRRGQRVLRGHLWHCGQLNDPVCRERIVAREPRGRRGIQRVAAAWYCAVWPQRELRIVYRENGYPEGLERVGSHLRLHRALEGVAPHSAAERE